MSKLFKSACIAAIIGGMAISPAWAEPYGHRGGGDHRGHRGHVGWGGWGTGLLLGTAVYLAATAPSRAYYPRPPVYAAPLYVMPPVTVVRPVMAPPMVLPPPVANEDWWYYCAQPAGYFPNVRVCPIGWTRVAPMPPG